MFSTSFFFADHENRFDGKDTCFIETNIIPIILFQMFSHLFTPCTNCYCIVPYISTTWVSKIQPDPILVNTSQYQCNAEGPSSCILGVLLSHIGQVFGNPFNIDYFIIDKSVALGKKSCMVNLRPSVWNIPSCG